MTASQETAWAEHAGTYLIEVPRAEHGTSIAAGVTASVAEIFGREAPLVVEVGTGKGEAIVHAAGIHHQKNFLGIEVYRAGLAKTMMEAGNLGLTNLRLIEANAPDVLGSFLPVGSVSELRIFFPDPWHKAKHTKRRLINDDFVAMLSSRMAVGARVRMATDWLHYAEQMRDVFDANPAFARDFEGEYAERFAERPLTTFEKKGLKVGRTIYDLTFLRV